MILGIYHNIVLGVNILKFNPFFTIIINILVRLKINNLIRLRGDIMFVKRNTLETEQGLNPNMGFELEEVKRDDYIIMSCFTLATIILLITKYIL